jgi:hypothetical protein
MFTMNPEFDWTRFAGNALQDVGLGLTQAPTIWGGIGRSAQISQEKQPYRDAYATQQKAEAERAKLIAEQAAKRDQYATSFEANGVPSFVVDAVRNGDADPVDVYWKLMAPQQPGEPVRGIEINGQLVNPITGEPMGDFRTPETPKQPAAPSGYQWTPEGTQTFIPGGPADPASAAANKGDTEQTRRAKQLASVVNPQLDIAVNNFDALSDGGNQFWSGVNQGSGVGTSPAFQQARNAVQTIAQSYLYSVSGAAAPAEEVKKLVDSVTPVPFESPEAVADKKDRLKQMVDAINLMANGGGSGASPAGTTYTFNPATGELE